MMQRDVLALYLGAGHPRVPWYVKVLAAMTAAYALSPVDLVPDFIPVLGYLDDALILPAAIAVIVRLMPKDVMAELREEAATRLAAEQPRSRVGAAAIMALWVGVCALLVWLVWFR